MGKPPACAAHQAGDLMRRAFSIKLASAKGTLRAYCPKANIGLREDARWVKAIGRATMFMRVAGAAF